jgi:hypothetical protein
MRFTASGADSAPREQELPLLFAMMIYCFGNFDTTTLLSSNKMLQ